MSLDGFLVLISRKMKRLKFSHGPNADAALQSDEG